VAANAAGCKESGDQLIGSFSCQNGRLTSTPTCGKVDSATGAETEAAGKLAEPVPIQFPFMTCSTESGKKMAMEIYKKGVEDATKKRLERPENKDVDMPDVTMSEAYLNACRACYAEKARRLQAGNQERYVELNTYVTMRIDSGAPSDAEDQKKQFEAMAALTSALSQAVDGKSFMEEVADSVAAAAQEELTDAKGDAEKTNAVKSALPSTMSGGSASGKAFYSSQTTGPHAAESASAGANNPFAAAGASNTAFSSDANKMGKVGSAPAAPSSMDGVVINLPKADIDSGLGAGAIIGIICGCIVGVLALAFAVLKVTKK